MVVLSRFSILLELNFSSDFVNSMTCKYFLSFLCSTRRIHERKPLLPKGINKYLSQGLDFTTFSEPVTQIEVVSDAMPGFSQLRIEG